jgi:hypothetical protein
MAEPQNSDDLKQSQSSDAPTIFVDGAVGSAFAGGVHRILFAEFVVDATRGAKLPMVRHAVNLVIPSAAVPGLIEFLQQMPGLADNEG